MNKQVKKIIYDLVLVFLNYIIAYIPCWCIRKVFYVLAGMKIGKHSRINQRVFVYNPWNIEIGDNTIINSFSIIDGRGGLKVGSNTSVSMRSVIYTASHKTYSNSFEYVENATEIGDCCWICVGAVILPGSQIADKVVIGANAVFKGDSESCGIYAGNPATYVRHRNIDNEYIINCKEYFT